jgi:hypothetical protein
LVFVLLGYIFCMGVIIVTILNSLMCTLVRLPPPSLLSTLSPSHLKQLREVSSV